MALSQLVRHEERGVTWHTFGRLDSLGFLKHWITARGLSLGGGENGAESVKKNRRLAEELFCGGRRIYLPTQVHGCGIVEFRPPAGRSAPADAVIVSSPGAPAGVLTADCIPLILVDPENECAAVVHAGRMGVFNGIIPAVIERMERSRGTDPRGMYAAIGPAIRKCCYEVGDDVFGGGHERYKKYRGDGDGLDIVGAAVDQLLESGLGSAAVLDSGVCTSCRADEFFSHRKEKGKAGRFMTGIMLL